MFQVLEEQDSDIFSNTHDYVEDHVENDEDVADDDLIVENEHDIIVVENENDDDEEEEEENDRKEEVSLFFLFFNSTFLVNHSKKIMYTFGKSHREKSKKVTKKVKKFLEKSKS